MPLRVGLGFDIHAFSDEPDRVLTLGGVAFAGQRGLSGHSDADVVAHACADALLGAAGLGDLGAHFPDDDPQWAGADSIVLLERVAAHVREAGWEPVNVDCAVVLETPKLAPARDEMQVRLSDAVGAPVSVKANRAEGLGAIGRGEGIACQAVALGERAVTAARSSRRAQPRRGAPSRGPRRPAAGGRSRPPSGPVPGRKRSAERGLGGTQVEGRQAVRELLLADARKTHEVWVSHDQDRSAMLDDIAELAARLRVPVREVSRAKLASEARSESPQGVLAKATALPEHDLAELAAARPGGGAPFLVIVDGITDPGNLGALLRSAEAAGVTGVVLAKHRAVHITPTVTKAAAGAVEYLPMALVGGLPTAIRQLQSAGVWVVGLDAGGPASLFELEVADAPIALVLGAEGTGLSRLVRARCDVVCAIPLAGRLASLNVSAAGALACFEVARRRRNP